MRRAMMISILSGLLGTHAPSLGLIAFKASFTAASFWAARELRGIHHRWGAGALLLAAALVMRLVTARQDSVLSIGSSPHGFRLTSHAFTYGAPDA